MFMTIISAMALVNTCGGARTADLSALAGWRAVVPMDIVFAACPGRVGIGHADNPSYFIPYQGS